MLLINCDLNWKRIFLKYGPPAWWQLFITTFAVWYCVITADFYKCIYQWTLNCTLTCLTCASKPGSPLNSSEAFALNVQRRSQQGSQGLFLSQQLLRDDLRSAYQCDTTNRCWQSVAAGWKSKNNASCCRLPIAAAGDVVSTHFRIAKNSSARFFLSKHSVFVCVYWSHNPDVHLELMIKAVINTWQIN